MGRVQERVADDPIVGDQPAGGEPSSFRHSPDPGDHEVGLDYPPVSETDPAGALAGLDGADLGTVDQIDPVISMQRSADLTDLRPDGPGERHGLGIYEGHVQAQRAGAGRDLRADETSSDDHDVPAF